MVCIWRAAAMETAQMVFNQCQRQYSIVVNIQSILTTISAQ